MHRRRFIGSVSQAFEQPPESDSDNPVVALSVNGVDSDDSPLIFFVPSCKNNQNDESCVVL